MAKSHTRFSFFDLPKNVRTDILFLSDLVRPCYVDLARGRLRDIKANRTLCVQCHEYERIKGVDRRQQLPCVCPPIPVNLFCISSAIYQEVVTVFFQFNKLLINGRAHHSLENLQRLERKALPSLRYLHISLDDHAPAELADAGALGAKAAGQWSAVCDYIASNLTPRQSCFHVYCQMTEALAAKRITGPLGKLPVMKKCGLRLGQGKDDTFQTLARATIRKIMGQPDETSFPLERLPSEIRSHILYYIGLVASVAHSRSWGAKMYIRNGVKSPRYDRCCGKCTEAKGECCCISRRSAFSTSSDCVVIPTVLLRLNKLISPEAIDVCYGKNQFRFVGDPLLNLNILLCLPRHSVKLIRHIYYCFGLVSIIRLSKPECMARRHWIEFVHFLMQSMDVTQLSLHITATTLWRFSAIGGWPAEMIIDTERAILAPLREMRGLKSAFIDMVGHGNKEIESIEREIVGQGYGTITHDVRGKRSLVGLE